jgi:FxsC-like protein
MSAISLYRCGDRLDRRRGERRVPTTGSDERPPYFFLSYARSDDDSYVEQFYRDLCGEVRVRAGLASTEDVGFLDSHSIEIGSQWSAELVDAMSTCSTFLALCSPRYIVSEQCGREWQLFADRCARFGRAGASRATALLPVLWLPPRRLPDVVRRVQYDNEVFSEAYRRDGLRQLMRLRRNQDDYFEALAIIAQHIVDDAHDNRLLAIPVPERATFAEVPSAFHPPPVPPGAPRTARSPEPADASRSRPIPAPRVDHVLFIVAAPSRGEAGAVRGDLEFYGDASLDWAPYRPALGSPIAGFAREIAARRGLTSEASPVSITPAFQRAGAGGEAAAAGAWLGVAPRHIVVLLVDAWATQLDHYRRALVAHESWPEAPAAALVPRSHEDRETHEHWRRLSDGLRSLFLGRIASGEALAYRPSILTHRAFDEDLQVVLETARNRLFARAGPPRATWRPERPRPILEGP